MQLLKVDFFQTNITFELLEQKTRNTLFLQPPCYTKSPCTHKLKLLELIKGKVGSSPFGLLPSYWGVLIKLFSLCHSFCPLAGFVHYILAGCLVFPILSLFGVSILRCEVLKPFPAFLICFCPFYPGSERLLNPGIVACRGHYRSWTLFCRSDLHRWSCDRSGRSDTR